jgi:two-component system, NtrC family, response regulator AtoC
MPGKHDESSPTQQSQSHGPDVPELQRRYSDQQRWILLVVQHKAGTESVVLEPGVPVVVGRCPPSALIVPSVKISRTHARFTLDPTGGIVVEDLGSTNGTWVAGATIERAAIEPGDEVVLGDALARVQVTTPGKLVGAAAVAAASPVAGAPAMRAALDMAARVAGAAVPVILQGETGTGKEVMARFLHDRSPRASRPMVSVNCAAIPAQLVESTLFGHERGAFTGAANRQKGVFEEADGGTVFLDEIGELGLPAQAALLRVLETGRFSRVGSPREIAVDVRVVAATHRDLEALRDAGQFRADLYYRLSVMVIHIPALRDRVDDIEPLARRFMAQASSNLSDIAPDALRNLRAYAWPGNVRELRNIIERASLLATTDILRAEDLPAQVREAPRRVVPRDTAMRPPPSEPEALMRPPPSEPEVLMRPHPSEPEALMRPPQSQSETVRIGELRARLNQYEARNIQEMLEQTGWNQSEAARRLGMPIRTLSHKVKVLGLKRP